ncbi:hypothetical protein [Dorea sp. D27]|uniref:hypothetical protein n=1 Tax=Dorea sp. D27 TaxID=658665 RepID=UPI0006738619|nr:hypothetical protein [Dorea sp. D27]KMZ55326.1 transmembrane 7 superfamily member 3 [Dorea sp. D27]
MAEIDRYSFIWGMIAAFGECVAQEVKKTAFSPPFPPSELKQLEEEAERIMGEQGLSFYLEKNPDIPEDKRVYWWVLYKFPEALSEYEAVRERGHNPAWEFDKFKDLLSYGTAWGSLYEDVVPEIRKEAGPMDPVVRILFPDHGWPIERDV